jgi:hypothetical protein
MLHGLPCSRSDKCITLSASLADSLIHKRCDSVIVVTSHELGKRASVEFAPRCLQPRCEPLSVLEHIVRDRDSGFHAESITAKRCHAKAGGTGKLISGGPVDPLCRWTMAAV